jgi:hypothetical protein
MDAAILQFNASDPAAWRERMLEGTAPEPVRLAAAAREFESLLLRQYLSEALKPITSGGTVFGTSNPMYGYLVTDSLARGLTGCDLFGFSNLVQAQLAGAIDHSHDDTNDTL